VRISYTAEEVATNGSMRQARIASRAQRKRIDLSWQNVGSEVETAVRQHFDEYGQRGRTFAYQPPPTLSHTEAQYAYDEPLSVDRTNPRNVSMRCALLEAMASD
jgi:hypothetical protein